MVSRQNKHPAGAAPAEKAAPATDAQRAAKNLDGLQGEGNYGAARVFNDAERKFVASGKVPAAARAAAPRTEAEGQEMLAAEDKGKARAKEDGTTSRTRKEVK
jgi:hypothetical protein